MNNLKSLIKTKFSEKNIDKMRSYYRMAFSFSYPLLWLYGKYINTPVQKLRNFRKSNRKLEIGPGPLRIDGFETVNIMWFPNVDYVADASKKLPFKNESFSLIYASHILEHIPWYLTKQTLTEWHRVLQYEGVIEIWVPNGLLIAKSWVAAEDLKSIDFKNDAWFKFNAVQDPALWANGRLFSYGDGTGKPGHSNWHLATFSPRLLKDLLAEVGFTQITYLDREAVRGHDHGWINLGVRAIKTKKD